jgi:hypothetical protein
MSILETLASLPQVNSRRVASDILNELAGRGLVIVPREATEGQLDAARDWSVAKYGMGIGRNAAEECWEAMINKANG